MRGYVLLGDVVGSREIENRDAFDERLRDVCDRVNRSHADVLRADLTRLKGVDEVGAVLASLAPLYDLLVDVYDGLDPHRVRFGFVEGGIDVGWETSDVREMDGPAFHAADEALGRLDRESLWFDMESLVGDASRRALFRAIGGGINTLLYLRSDMTDRQREFALAYEELGTQSAVARQFDVSQQAVSKTLEAANWRMLRTLEGRTRELLAELDE